MVGLRTSGHSEQGGAGKSLLRQWLALAPIGSLQPIQPFADGPLRLLLALPLIFDLQPRPLVGVDGLQLGAVEHANPARTAARQPVAPRLAPASAPARSFARRRTTGAHRGLRPTLSSPGAPLSRAPKPNGLNRPMVVRVLRPAALFHRVGEQRKPQSKLAPNLNAA